MPSRFVFRSTAEEMTTGQPSRAATTIIARSTDLGSFSGAGPSQNSARML